MLCCIDDPHLMEELHELHVVLLVSEVPLQDPEYACLQQYAVVDRHQAHLHCQRRSQAGTLGWSPCKIMSNHEKDGPLFALVYTTDSCYAACAGRLALGAMDPYIPAWEGLPRGGSGRTLGCLYQQGWPLRVMELSMMSSATRKKACSCGHH